MSKKACPCFQLSRFDQDLSCFGDQTSDDFVDRSVTLMPMWIEGPFFPEASCGSLIPSHLLHDTAYYRSGNAKGKAQDPQVFNRLYLLALKHKNQVH